MVSSGDSTEKVPIRSHMLERLRRTCVCIYVLHARGALARHRFDYARAQCRAPAIRHPAEFDRHFASGVGGNPLCRDGEATGSVAQRPGAVATRRDDAFR